ncbi:MAG TPA: glycosyltransferase [Kofleriaceae bacterium]|jgi:glycosyltransferase involved in cell wall biosynthesis|nr:glycosyltransferase [Kofleriaceae bacterium]
MSNFAVVPVLDEAAAVGALIGELRASWFDGVIVVDGGSHDDTAARARAAGAEVVVEPRRGYGRALMAGIAAARWQGARTLTFVDGNGTVSGADAGRVLAPVACGDADLAVGCRAGAGLRWLQRLGNRLAIEIIERAHGVRYADIGSVRAISMAALDRLAPDEPAYGWPLQLMMRAAAGRLRIEQVPIALRPRRSRSKISGTVRGTLGASATFVRLLAGEWRPPP